MWVDKQILQPKDMNITLSHVDPVINARPEVHAWLRTVEEHLKRYITLTPVEIYVGMDAIKIDVKIDEEITPPTKGAYHDNKS